MAKFRSLMRWAMVSGPVVIQAVQRYGPTIKHLIDSNPQAMDALTGKLRGYQDARKTSGVVGVTQRIEVLREQVNHLYGSANTPEVARQARDWRGQLDRIESGLPLLDAMSAKARRRRTKDLERKLDRVSSKILAAVVEDDVQDAEVLEETSAPGKESTEQ